MPDTAPKRDRDVARLSPEQRDWIRRQARVARALEAAERRRGRRFERPLAAERSRSTPVPPGARQ